MKRIGAVIVGLACFAAVAHADPLVPDFSDDSFTGVKKGMNDAKMTKMGYNPDNNPPAGQPSKPGQAVEWISIPGGKFTLGTPDFGDAQQIPDKIYNIKTFSISKTLVTVEQYAEYYSSLALNSTARAAAKPGTGGYCNWGKTDRDRSKDPINCVDWNQARAYATFKGGRLPSESEWEYVATSGGKNYKYPWGNTPEVTCETAVMSVNGGYGCGTHGTMPVCSKPAGNTKIDGLAANKQLCDMVGNVWEWTQDTYQSSYAHTPTDGSANEGTGSRRALRGGSFRNSVAEILRAARRDGADRGLRLVNFGFRLARSSR